MYRQIFKDLLIVSYVNDFSTTEMWHQIYEDSLDWIVFLEKMLTYLILLLPLYFFLS